MANGCEEIGYLGLISDFYFYTPYFLLLTFDF